MSTTGEKPLRPRIGGKPPVRQRRATHRFAARTDHEPWLDGIFDFALGASAGAFVDVGANLGQNLTKLVRRDKSRRYVGFEPQLAAAVFIDRLIVENGLRQHTVLPLALSNRRGLVRLMTRDREFTQAGSGVASIVSGFRPDDFYGSSQAVWAIPGDEALRGLTPTGIALIKVDVEGAELEVIDGLRASIRRYQPVILFEVLNHFLLLTGRFLDDATIDFREQRTRKLESLLRGHGYRIHRIDRNAAPIEVERIKPRRSRSHSDANYVAVPHRLCRHFLDSIAPGSQ